MLRFSGDVDCRPPNDTLAAMKTKQASNNLYAAWTVSMLLSCWILAGCATAPSTKSATCPPCIAAPSYQRVPWRKHTNIYEVNVRQYTPEGTFKAFAKHMPRLRDMGVDVLWFMPVTPIAQLKRKGPMGSYYASSDFKSVNPEFGTLEDFQQLVRDAHSLGLK